MNMIDIIIILLFLMTATVGLKRGVLKELVYFVGTILIFFIAFKFKDSLGTMLCKYFPFFEFGGKIKGLVSLNIFIYESLAFLIIITVLYGVFNIVLSVTGIMQKIVNITVILAIPSKIIGFIIGFIECYFIMFIILVLFAVPFKQLPGYTESKLVDKIMNDSPVMTKDIDNVKNAAIDTYKSIDSITKSNKTVNEINLNNIDIMLKYKIVDKKTIEELDILGKLDTVSNLKSVLNKY